MTSNRLPAVALVALAALPFVLAHGDEHRPDAPKDMTMDMSKHGHGNGAADLPKPESEYPPTYFALADHASLMYAHIILMVLGWIFILPISVMLSIARSKYTLVVRLAFVAVNSFGVITAVIYNAKTPDLYPGNAHHSVSWVMTAVVSVQAVIGFFGHIAGVLHKSNGTGPASYLPVSAATMAERERLQGSEYASPYRRSNDSGQGTERNTESLRSHSLSSNEQPYSPRSLDARRVAYGDDFADDDTEDAPMMLIPSQQSPFHVKRVVDRISERTWRILLLASHIVDRSILPLGFLTFCLGIATYGRFFEGRQIYSGMAHWVKGGIFFWLGLFTLGRWAGSFGEVGWAWNVRPKTWNAKWRPSAEFVESLLIFVYGATNIFMEHMGRAGGAWTSQDLEHVSITVLFIGGGLLGMLIESTCIRDLLNTTVDRAIDQSDERGAPAEDKVGAEESTNQPASYEFSINPVPALVILLLGIMMSSHTQQSMISTMVHKQWGNLLTGASFARGLTYVLLYLKPPSSVYPSRPPTELLTSFGLIAGGAIFMASASDTITGMIHYELDAMFMYTVTMGLAGLLMAWVIAVLAIKGWVVRKEAHWHRAT